MKIETDANVAHVALEPGERFFFKGSHLRGVSSFNWSLVPPFPFGSPIARTLHGCYFGMKYVDAGTEARGVAIIGHHPRGSFYSINVPPGHQYYVNARLLAGFSSRFERIHTHIKVAPVYWCVNKHFFPVFTGPGKILLYSASPIQGSEALEFQPERIAAFNIQRRFRAVPPEPTTMASQGFNVFSHEIIWRFLDDGQTFAESHNYEKAHAGKGSLGRVLKHFLGFLSF